MAITRLPHQVLRPFVRLVWAADGEGAGVAGHERMLPSTCPHLVLRLDDAPVEVFAPGAAAPFRHLGPGVVAGPRWSPYIRSASGCGRSLGALLKPAATHAVLGVPSKELAGRHTALTDILGKQADLMRERLVASRSLEEALTRFEQMLLEKLRPCCAPHPAVMHALSRLTGCVPVHTAVQESGYSHRQFNVHFRTALGMTPKLYSRVLRFERAVAHWGDSPGIALSQLAARSGYSDQSHLSREFRELAGISMTSYQALTTPGSRHVPLQRDPTVQL